MLQCLFLQFHIYVQYVCSCTIMSIKSLDRSCTILMIIKLPLRLVRWGGGVSSFRACFYRAHIWNALVLNNDCLSQVFMIIARDLKMSPGRPKVNIDAQELLQHFRAGKSQTQIADEYGITRKTLRRILVENNITSFRYQNNLTQEEIDRETANAKVLMPFAGERLIIGHFRSLG